MPTPDRGMLDGMWNVEVVRGSAEDFHRRELPGQLEPTLWWFEVESFAIVLGSSQPIEHLDLGACARDGCAVVRRRSGGGAVLMRPQESHWVDVLLPRDDPRWTDDVSASAWWLGEAWSRALAGLGVSSTTVHHGPMVTTPWSSRLCFAGVGGGEVVAYDGSKLVGISQRRVRAGARFQCIVHRRWNPEANARLFSPPGPTPGDLARLAAEVTCSAADLRAALRAELA